MKSLILNFLKYIKYCSRGGYTQLTLSPIQYPALLQGKRALVTGGSEGIGLAIARKFVEAGATVIITGRNLQKLERAAQEVKSERLVTMQWDVCDISRMDERLAEIESKIGGLDIWVNNAAYVTNNYSTEQVWDRTMDTNVKAPYFLTRAVAEYMKLMNGVEGGKIINISSINAYQSWHHPYFVSKRALNMLTEGFAKEYAPYNILVNAVAPGFCDSSINKQDASKNAYWPDAANRRITVPQDIAEIVMFLCSGAANGIVGQTIVCDGGTLL